MNAFADELIKVGGDPIDSAVRSTNLKPQKNKDSEMSGRQTAAVAAAGASPFAGMIGEKPLINDPHVNKGIKKFKTPESLAQAARPGDIVITSKDKSLWKTFSSPVSGSEFFHAQPVVGRPGRRPRTLTAGEYSWKDAQKINRNKFMAGLDEVADIVGGKSGYKDIVLLRPKKGMTDTQLKSFMDDALDRSRFKYDSAHAVKTWMKDVFVPKLSTKGSKAKGVTKIEYRTSVDPKTGKKVRTAVKCVGNICSTVPSQSYSKATGEAVVKGKKAVDVMPADFLRSDKFSAVGASVTGSGPSAAKRLRGRLLVRGGAGAALAGGAYATTERPEAVGAIAGAAAGGKINESILKRMAAKRGQDIGDFAPEIKDILAKEDIGSRRKIIGQYLKKRVAGKAIGAAAGLAAAHHLAKKFRKGNSNS